MPTSESQAVTVLLTQDHLRKITEEHLLAENELGDRIKMARVIQKLVDSGLGLPDRPWHDWDDWAKGLDV